MKPCGASGIEPRRGDCSPSGCVRTPTSCASTASRSSGWRGESRLEIVPGAGQRFEEPGALDRVAALARDWFVAHLVS